MRQKISEKLQSRLLRIGFDVELPKRTNAYMYSGTGAWSWSARHKGSLSEIGSGYTMRDCVSMTDDELKLTVEKMSHDPMYE